MHTIGVLDYGMGNIGSIVNMLKKIGARPAILTSPENLLEVEKIILPGIGTFDRGMERLRQQGWIPALEKRVLEEKIPIMGICLGMQLFTKKSEEGESGGLGWIDAEVKRFRPENLGYHERIPHLGWNTITVDKQSRLFSHDKEELRFYFLHSYHVSCNLQEDILCTTTYGQNFTSAFESNNIIGVQFHPEKSHRFGINLFHNFVNNI